MAQQNKYPNTREILYLLGLGTFLTASILLPGLAIAGNAIIKAKRKHDYLNSQKEWRRFNHSLLKRNIKRLQNQKVIEIIAENGEEIIKLTQKGKTRFLKFRLEDLSIKGKVWDGKWRLVIYDISHLKRTQQDQFRRILKQMNFLALQESVYLTPLKCEEAIEYLREYFDLSKEVILIEASKLENERYYKEYFGIS